MVKITNDRIYITDNLQQFSKMPVTGLISIWTGIAIPANTLLCDGKPHTISAYPDLANFLGYTSTSGSFNVPNFEGRLPLGADNTTTITNGGYTIGGANEISSIGHSHTADISPVYTHHYRHDTPEIGNGGGWNYSLNSYGHTVTTDYNTTTAQIDYLPPYTVVKYIIHT
jgi:hypothetical protein